MSAAAGAESVAAAQMNDPKSEDSEKSCENKSGQERARGRENKQSEPFVCLYLTAATDGASVRTSAKNLRGGGKRENRERKGKPEEEE